MAVGNRTNQKQNCPYCSNQRVLKGYNDLETLFPDVAKSWDYENNGDLLPSMVTSRTNKKVFWVCPNNHSYLAAVAWRTHPAHPTGCPYCSHNKVLDGFNDFATICPDKVKYWDYEKNGLLKPNEITPYSGRYVWWKCPDCNQSWRSKVQAFSGSMGCPRCYRRRQTSFGEQSIYYYVHCLYQDAISRYKIPNGKQSELDIYIPSINTAVEYDGCVFHSDERSLQKENRKYQWCAQNNIKLIRVKEYKQCYDSDNIYADNSYYVCIDRKEYENNLSIIIRQMLNDICRSNVAVMNDIDVDVTRDRQLILRMYIDCGVKNSLYDKFPNIVKYWDYERNLVSPSHISYSSTISVWWKCADCGVSFQKPVCEVTHKGRNPLYYCRSCIVRSKYSHTWSKGKTKENDIRLQSVANKLSVRQSKPVIGIDADGNKHYFPSIKLATQWCFENGCRGVRTGSVMPNLDGGGAISRCLNGRNKTAYGYHWEYADK